MYTDDCEKVIKFKIYMKGPSSAPERIQRLLEYKGNTRLAASEASNKIGDLEINA